MIVPLGNGRDTRLSVPVPARAPPTLHAFSLQQPATAASAVTAESGCQFRSLRTLPRNYYASHKATRRENGVGARPSVRSPLVHSSTLLRQSFCLSLLYSYLFCQSLTRLLPEQLFFLLFSSENAIRPRIYLFLKKKHFYNSLIRRPEQLYRLFVIVRGSPISISL